MVTLFQFDPEWDLPNPSPFCMKVQLFMDVAKIPYKISDMDQMKILKGAPKGKLPYIEHNGTIIPDSEFIIDYLSKEFNFDMDKDLSDEQKGVSAAFQRCFDENLYWVVVYSRWFEEENWSVLKGVFFRSMPAFLRSFLPDIIRKGVAKSLHGHGIGRHSREEIYKIAAKDVEGISQFLGNKKYFFGDKPSRIDITAYSNLANILWVPLESPLKDITKKYENLEKYCESMKKYLESCGNNQ